MSAAAVEDDDTDLPLDERDVADAARELLAMCPEEFADVVSDDVTADLDDDFLRAALRRDEVLDRWHAALTELAMSIEAQMAAAKGKKDAETNRWRGAARRVLSGAVARRTECRILKRQRHVAATPVIAIPGKVKTTQEAKRDAGEKAVQRLKDAHPEEFMDYLAQEYGKAGLPVPAHWIRGYGTAVAG